MSTTVPANSRPWTVTAAFWLFLCSLAMSLLATIFSITAVNSADGQARIREVSEKTINELPADEQSSISVQSLTDIAVGTTVILAVLTVAISLVASLLPALLAFNGKRAARIIATIFAVLGTLTLLLGFNWLTLLFSYLLFLLATIFLWLQPSTEYFDRAREAKIMSQQYPTGQQ